MVDSINGAGKPPASINEIYVNWKKCTADEVLKYEKDGREVPDNILKWAEEVAKIANAPEDITYEATNGSSDVNGITLGAEKNGKEPQISAAQADRQQMQEDGSSLYDQGKSFIDKSKEASVENMKMMISTTQTANSSDSAAGQAEAEATMTEAKTKTMKKEYDTLMEKAQNDNGQGLSKAEQTRLVNLGQQLNKIGTSSQGKLQDMSTQVQALDSSIAAFENVPPNALDYGTETVNVGLELLGAKAPQQPAQNAAIPETTETTQSTGETQEDTTQTDVKTRSETAVNDMQKAKEGVNIFAAFFDRDIRMGLRAGSQGTSTINVGNKGQEKLDANEGITEQSKTKVADAQSKVADATMVKAKSNETNNTGDEQNANGENNTENTDKPQDKAEAQDSKQTLADTTITADTNEILKRKERKGIPT